jgi:hypothetical protein
LNALQFTMNVCNCDFDDSDKKVSKAVKREREREIVKLAYLPVQLKNLSFFIVRLKDPNKPKLLNFFC